ncbi:hypothetical protein G5714_024635 [Onychostoma macrolepis]|uniref:Uncharacterized protein n=1 Tax=Onychostoma macrolepis TaxID=369639 RepID=A0A7J6BK10_9TELE|nr:hypothetical protein G5714_024635 [Onychostoma macrolepis]
MRPGFLVGTAVLSAAGLACSLGWVTELARVQVVRRQCCENRAEGVQVPVVVAEWLRRWTRNPLGSPSAGSNPADSLFASPPARRGEVAVLLFCTSLARLCAPPLHRTNTPLDLFADQSGSRQPFAVEQRDAGLLFASSSFSWILSLTLGGVLCCPPAAKGAGGPQLVIGVVVAEWLRRCVGQWHAVIVIVVSTLRCGRSNPGSNRSRQPFAVEQRGGI